MKSMTGFGRGIMADDAGNRLTIEISAVNSRKQVDIRLTLPRELAFMEVELRQFVQQRLSRGSVHIVVSYQLAGDNGALGIRISTAAVLEAARVLGNLAKESGLAAPTLADVLALPGIVEDDGIRRYEVLESLLAPTLDTAIAALQQARVEEGVRLKADLLQRGVQMKALLERIIGREHEALVQFKERLRQRVALLGLEVTADDERLAKEMVFYADKSDISEETVRLQSHLVKYEQLLNSPEDTGRELDFLGQEMNREITTLSSKTADLCISTDAMALKVEISKVREQFMNIE